MTIFQLIETLRARGIHFTLASHRENVVMALAAVPGERWEIEIFSDGSLQLEIFRSNGEIYDESGLSQRIADVVN